MNPTEEITVGVGSYLGAVRRRMAWVVRIGPIPPLVAVYLAFTLPALYRSTATILLEPSSVNKDVVASTVTSYSNEQIEIIEGRVLTLETLKQLVREYDPYPRDRAASLTKKAQHLQADTSVERVDPVSLKPEDESNAFSVHYDNPDPERAAAVAARLAALFLTYNQRTRTDAAREAAALLASQAAAITEQLHRSDDDLRQFKAKHGDALPEDVQRNESEIDRAQHDLDSLDDEIHRAEEKESLLSVQLSQTSPNMITQTGDLTDIPTTRAKLAEAEQRYTPEHPEVIRLKRALEVLMAQNKVGSGGIVSGANNPQYLTTATQLKSARNELAGLRAQASRLHAEIASYEELLRRTPGAEREYSEIIRRRASLQSAYEQLQDKLQNARLAESFEAKEQGERFTLLRSPYPAKLPVYPNRIGLVLLGLILGAAFAGIAVAVAEVTDPTLRSTADLPRLADAPLLASIPPIPNSQDVRRGRFVRGAWFAAYAAAFTLVCIRILALQHR